MEYFVTEYKTDSSAGSPGTKRAVLEDTIMHKGYMVTAGSRHLDSYISPISATVVTRLEAAGVAILGKTAVNEFGAAGFLSDEPMSTYYGAVDAVADGIADFALCNDYTGIIGQQGAARGLYYIHPTYGTVSRYGLIPAVPSMDQIGILCKSPEDGFKILSIIAGKDEGDGAMLPDGSFDDSLIDIDSNDDMRNIRIGVPENVVKCAENNDGIIDFVEGFQIADFELAYYEIYEQLMGIICSAELSCNISRYDGVKFGYRASNFTGIDELYLKSRSEAFGPDAKLAAMLGAMVLSHENYARFYDKSMRILRLVKDSLEFETGEYDLIIMPAYSRKREQEHIDKPQKLLALQALGRLCGLPSVTVPTEDGGITIIANAQCEQLLYKVLQSTTAR